MSFFDTVKKFTLFILLCSAPLWAQAQQYRPAIQEYLKTVQPKFKLTDLDIAAWSASDQYTDRATGITYTYLQQEVDGVRIFNAISTVAIKGGKVGHFASRFLPNAAGKANSAVPQITAGQAVVAAAAHLNLPLNETPAGVLTDEGRQEWLFGNCGISKEGIIAKLYYVQDGQTLRLAWSVVIDERSGSDCWNVRIDAATGQFIEKNNYTVSCSFDCKSGTHDHSQAVQQSANAPKTIAAGPQYNVFELPVEAPNFGGRTLISETNSTVASPYGWHDTDGVDGADTTITLGNNVHAYEDEDDNNQPGYAPDGGPDLNFDFPLDLNWDTDTNRNAIITNLFYMNNMIHDILYVHGFDEAAGNFQVNNYGNGGEDGDYVRAEAQDGAGLNNANFSTPADGNRPRMQMFLWNPAGPSYITLDPAIAPFTKLNAYQANFGPTLKGPFSGKLVLVNDGIDQATDGCDSILNAAEIAGNIAVVDRSSCSIISQVEKAQAAGAIGVIICNNVITPPSAPTDPGSTTIPGLMISRAHGDSIKTYLQAGVEFNSTIYPAQMIDGSLDNGIIAHEYGHGLSNRLTGGPSNSNCLTASSNGQPTDQGGEGWSDWLALILTIEPGDVGSSPRGIGTFAFGEAPTGLGIRRFPYSTNPAINSQNYDDVKTSNGVHPIGEIWASTIWDLTWKLIDAEGFDPDWYNGNAGNNTAMRLIIEGMKLQPCLPGYLDARDGILAADALLYNNAHRCMIWEVFAARGMGKDAQQGEYFNATDQVANFDIPNLCKTPIAPPVANFGVDLVESCISIFNFNDLSTDLPQYWHWDFGDGITSEEQNPIHDYAAPGTYNVVLTVTNSLGTDNHSLTVTYFVESAPSVTGTTTICAGNAATLTAQVPQGYTAGWFSNNFLVNIGDSFTTEKLTNPTTYKVRQISESPDGKVGPSDNTIGNGANQSSGAEGRLLFEAVKPFILKTALVFAKGDGNRTFKLYDENGQLIQTVTVFVPDGAHRIDLNLTVPAPGKYSIGGPGNQNLFRNFGGAAYPYTLDNVVNIYQSNYAANPTGFYFYLYDWEISFCFSEPAEVMVNITPGPVANFNASINDLTVDFGNNTVGSATSFTWNFGDGTPTTGTLNPTHIYATSGTYTVVLTVTDGSCTSSFEREIIVGTTATVDLENNLKVRVYPNPATDLIHVELSEAPGEKTMVEMTDETGRIVLQQSLASNAKQAQLRVGKLARGVYFVRLQSSKGAVVQKITLF